MRMRRTRPDPRGGSTAMVLDQIGPRVELLVGDPFRADGMILLDEAVEIRGDPFLVETGFRDVEVEPALAFAHLAARDGVGENGGEQVHTGVHTHQTVTPLPVDLRRDPRAGRDRRRLLRRDMQDTVRSVALDRTDDGNRGPVAGRERAAVSRLSAARRVEHGPVELNTALVHGDDGRLACPGIGVLAKYRFHRSASVGPRA